MSLRKALRTDSTPSTATRLRRITAPMLPLPAAIGTPITAIFPSTVSADGHHDVL